MVKKGIILIFFIILFIEVFPSDYDFSVFTFEEVNTLRQVKPIKRLRIYRKAICKYSQKMVFSMNFLDFKKVEVLNEKLVRVFKYTTGDLVKCIQNRENRSNTNILDLYRCFVVCEDRLKGVQNGLPEKKKNMVKNSLNKCKFLKRQLRGFIFGDER